MEVLRLNSKAKPHIPLGCGCAHDFLVDSSKAEHRECQNAVPENFDWKTTVMGNRVLCLFWHSANLFRQILFFVDHVDKAVGMDAVGDEDADGAALRTFEAT